jgi:hypothetical protein
MPTPTPRERLIDRVQSRFIEQGFNSTVAQSMAILAVDQFYAGNQGDTWSELVAAESYQIILDVMPTVVTHMRAAFEGMQQMITSMATTLGQFAPYAEMAGHALTERSNDHPEYDASGLPVTEGPRNHHKTPDPERGIPCIEEGCENTVEPGQAYCSDCQAEINSTVAQEVALEDTGRPLPSIDPAQIIVDEITGRRWLPPAVAADPNIVDGSTPLPIIELTEREFHLSAARRLRALGCTYQELKAMHDRRDFATSQHHSAWFNFGDLINLEQLDRANFVIDAMDGPGGVAFNLSDRQIELLERQYPTDRITGAPHHYVVNGDHSECGCGGDHLVSCSIWDVPHWRHKGSICGIARTLCIHSPRHTYGEPCAEYHENLVDLVDRITEGENAHGPAQS